MAAAPEIIAEGMAMSSDESVPATPPPELAIKGKTRQRLLRGVQRISSSPSLSGLRRARSQSSPYKNRSTISCVSLAGTGPPTPPSLVTPQSPPSGNHSTASSYVTSPGSEFPFYDAAEDLFAARKVGSAAPTSNPATASLPPDVVIRSARSVSKLKPLFRFWDAIPHEVQVYIFSFLRPKELVKASRVSKTFYKLCFDGQLWTSFDASEFYMDIPAEAVSRIIVAAGPFIQHLNLRGCVQVEHYKRTEAIARACRNLVNAKLEGCRNIQKSALSTLLRNNQGLVHLNLTGLSAVSNASCRIIAESCPHLENLNVSWCEKVEAKGIKAIVDTCSKLKDLRAGEIRGFDNLAMAESIFRTNNLQRLVLSGCAELTDEALQMMMHGPNPQIDVLTGQPEVAPRKLRHLDLSRCTRLSDTGVESIGYNTPELEGLQLSGCKDLTDAALEPILASTPRLSHLELEDLEEITNNLLSEHLAKAPCATNLEHLSLGYCENISDVGVLPIMQRCLNLKSIELDNTRISDLVMAEAACMVSRRSRKTTNNQFAPKVTLQMAVYDCPNVTWTGIREILFRNAQIKPAAGQLGCISYPTEAISLKCFYGYQMTVDEHTKRVLKGDLASARRLERKWADYMQATEEAGMVGSGHRRRRRRVREAHHLHLDEEDGGIPGRRRARTLGSCSLM